MPITSRVRNNALVCAVAAIAATVVFILIAAPPAVHRVVDRLPSVSSAAAGAVFVACCLAAAIALATVRLIAVSRSRSRREALEQSFEGEVVCGIRHPALVAALGDLGASAHLSSRFSVMADRDGVTFWSGGRRPRRAAAFAWREIRSIRSDSTVAGAREVPLLVLRVRRDGSSIELPIILGAERAGAFAVVEAPFFAAVRSWKAMHRAALAAEGLELPPLTAPIGIIPPETALAARR